MEFVLDGSPYKESSERKLLPMAKYSNSGPNHKFITLAQGESKYYTLLEMFSMFCKL